MTPVPTPANVSFHVAASTEVDAGRFDAVVFFDSLHDMAIRRPRCAGRTGRSPRAAS